MSSSIFQGCWNKSSGAPQFQLFKVAVLDPDIQDNQTYLRQFGVFLALDIACRKPHIAARAWKAWKSRSWEVCISVSICKSVSICTCTYECIDICICSYVCTCVYMYLYYSLHAFSRHLYMYVHVQSIHMLMLKLPTACQAASQAWA